MLCENCGSEPAVVHWTQIENDEMKTSHLCEACAAERGLATPQQSANEPLADFLAQLGKGMPADVMEVESCPSCGLGISQLRQAGRLGCAECYTHFEKQLRALLRRLHGGTQHVGKVVLPPDPDAADLTARVQSLRRSLERAVSAEDFEHAAVLRDQIRRLQGAHS